MPIIDRQTAVIQARELEQIVKFRPTPALAATLGACLFTLDRPEEALPLLQWAWDRDKMSDIGLNLGLVLKDLGRHSESLAVLEAAYHLNPDDQYLRLGYAEGLLKAGFWKAAWPLYDHARPTQMNASYDLRLPANVKEWNGKPIVGEHLLIVINEGGTGDRLSYARWLPTLSKMGINWKFYPYAELYSFFERIFPRERLLVDGEDIPEPTHWTTTFSLPAKLNVGPNDVPPPLPLTASEESKKKYRFQKKDGLPAVGLCWRAAELHQGGKQVRSMSEAQMMRLVCQTGNCVHWINLQHDYKAPFPIINVKRESWEDLAGLMHNLDYIVSVDTGPMHLAGAMGKTVLVALSSNSCWKFGKKPGKWNWYPSAHLYMNKGQGFEDSIDQIVADIQGKYRNT